MAEKTQSQSPKSNLSVFLDRLKSMKETAKRENRYVSNKLIDKGDIVMEVVASPGGSVVIRLRTQSVKNAIVVNTRHFKALMELFGQIEKSTAVKELLLDIFRAVYGSEEEGGLINL